MYGFNADILVMSPAEYKLACHMKEPTPVDLGNFVLSPMPGTLISFAVKVSLHIFKLIRFVLIPTCTYHLMNAKSLLTIGGRRCQA